jgi:hypothetical protein
MEDWRNQGLKGGDKRRDFEEYAEINMVNGWFVVVLLYNLEGGENEFDDRDV